MIETARVGHALALTDYTADDDRHSAIMTWLGDRNGLPFQVYGVWMFNQRNAPFQESHHKNWRLV